jgi:hypothetical protein
VQCCGCTPQRAAAAAMSRSRALAPTCCIFSRDNLTDGGPEPMAVAGLANNAYNVPNTRVDAGLSR